MPPPTLIFRLKIASADDRPVHATSGSAQIRIEPQRRRYGPAEADRPRACSAMLRSGPADSPAAALTHTPDRARLRRPHRDRRAGGARYDFEVGGAKHFHASTR
jgi:hypothetical protein